MVFNWKEELATGNKMIDTQHKQLFATVNDLMNACKGGQANGRLNSIIQFLIEYTVRHFNDEENLQQQYKYPGYPDHKKLHEDFKNTVSEWAKQLQSEGPTIALVTKIGFATGDWILKHIQNEDKKVAAHLHSCARDSSS